MKTVLWCPDGCGRKIVCMKVNKDYTKGTIKSIWKCKICGYEITGDRHEVRRLYS